MTPVFGGLSRQVGIAGQILRLRSEVICLGTSLRGVCDCGLVLVEGVADFFVGGADLRLLLGRRLLHFALCIGLGLDSPSRGRALRGLIGSAFLRGLLSLGGAFCRRDPGVDPVARVDAVQFGVCQLGSGLFRLHIGERLGGAGLFEVPRLRLLKLAFGGQRIVLDDRANDFLRPALNGVDQTLAGII